ncbi:MAG: hypothetical protein LBK94_13420 [Prevotellaceae bacterium]|jgi:hypothetical protein|nr:hypothetical protein [Prevotellaceae bacterium]
MFNIADIKNSLLGLVGWSDLNSPQPLTAENQESRSGRYFQDFHHSCTLSNVYFLMEKENASDTEFNDFLKRLQYSAILNSLNGVFNEDILIEQTLLFNRRGQTIPGVNATGKKAGYIIAPVKDSSYSLMLKNISLMFKQDGEVNIQLWHNNIGKIWEHTCQVEANKECIFIVNQAIYYSCKEYKGGFFYLCYDYGLEPVEYDICDFNKTYLFRAIPFEGTVLDNTATVGTGRTYGINAEICAYRDFTEIITLNQHTFSTLIGLQVAASCIELTLNSTRSNKTERITKEQQSRLYNDLNVAFSSPEFPYTTGIKNQIAREIKRIKQNYLPKQKLTTNTVCFTRKITL